MSGRMQSLRSPIAMGLVAGSAIGAGATVAPETAAAWDFGKVPPMARAYEYCPADATQPTVGPIDLKFGNGEPVMRTGLTDFKVDGTYGGEDIDFMVKDTETGIYGEVQEDLVVKAGSTAVAQLVGATYKPGENVKLTVKWTKNKSTHPVEVPVEVVPGAPCETPVPTPGGVTPQPLPTPGESVTPAPAPTPDKTPRRTSKPNRPSVVSIDKRFTGAPRFLTTGDGRVVVRDGDPVVRVSPGLPFNLDLRVRALNDGDGINGERVPVRITDFLPHIGSTALMYARNPRTGEYTVSRIGKRLTLREGAPAVTLRYKVAATPEAASPPREIENTACIEATGPQGGDRDCDEATFYDPFEAFGKNVNVFDQLTRR